MLHCAVDPGRQRLAAWVTGCCTCIGEKPTLSSEPGERELAAWFFSIITLFPCGAERREIWEKEVNVRTRRAEAMAQSQVDVR